MRFRKHLAVNWYAALAMAAGLVLVTPRTGRAGQVTVTENLPNTGFTQSFILGAGANTPLSPGQSYSVAIPAFTTPDGRFEFFINNISAADTKGFPSLTGSLSVVDVNGGQGSLFLDHQAVLCT